LHGCGKAAGADLQFVTYRTDGFNLVKTGDELYVSSGLRRRRRIMSWTTPSLVEICIGLEINGYLPAEF
jgi:coenzyme PQQ precursor peptide PqqA